MIQLNPRCEAIFKMNHIFHPTSDISLRSADYGVPSYVDNKY